MSEVLIYPGIPTSYIMLQCCPILSELMYVAICMSIQTKFGLTMYILAIATLSMKSHSCMSVKNILSSYHKLQLQ